MYYMKISQVPPYLSSAASVARLVDLKANCHGFKSHFSCKVFIPICMLPSLIPSHPPLLLAQTIRVLNTLLRSKVVAVYSSVVTLVNSCRTCVL